MHQFGDRWRDSGHVGEKVFAELQPLWKAAISNAAAPLEALQAQSIAARQAMIEEAKVLGDAPVLRIDAVKALQQRWQVQAHAVPIDRRQEQKLWDAFRKPIDEAFNRKTAEREKAETALGARDRVVLEAAKALEAANASGDANNIRAAMAALEAALQGQAQAQAEVTAAGVQESVAKAAVEDQDLAVDAGNAPSEAAAQDEVAPAVPVKPAPKPVIAMRGDDRPGLRKELATAAPARPGKWGDRKEVGAARGGRDGHSERAPRRDDRGERVYAPAAPRLGDTAFRAQRDALEHAQLALRKLAAQAHGEALTQLLNAWEKRDSTLVPPAQELGSRAVAQHRAVWVKAIEAAAKPAASQALLRLEMAADVPTPAEHLAERRGLQLQLLTRRNDPAPAETWGQDTAAVLVGAFDAADARRLQNVLKVLLKR